MSRPEAFDLRTLVRRLSEAARFLDKLEPSIWPTLSGTSSRSIPTTAWCSISARSACRSTREQADYPGLRGRRVDRPVEGRRGLGCMHRRPDRAAAPAVIHRRTSSVRSRSAVAPSRSRRQRTLIVAVSMRSPSRASSLRLRLIFSRSGYASIVRHDTT